MSLEQNINNNQEKTLTSESVRKVVPVEVLNEEDKQAKIEERAQKEKEDKNQIEKLKEDILKSFNGDNVEAITQIKQGVDFVFEQSPELSQIGTPEEYSKYIESIFPQSKVRDILYHYTSSKDKIMDDGFKSISELGDWVGSGDIDAIFLTKSQVCYWGGEKSKLDKVASIVDSRNAIDLSHLSKETKDEAELSEKDLIIYRKYNEILNIGLDNAFSKYENPTRIQIAEERKNEFIKEGYDSILHPELQEVAIFNKNQTHVLGSVKDIEQFKEFVSVSNLE